SALVADLRIEAAYRIAISNKHPHVATMAGEPPPAARVPSVKEIAASAPYDFAVGVPQDCLGRVVPVDNLAVRRQGECSVRGACKHPAQDARSSPFSCRLPSLDRNLHQPPRLVRDIDSSKQTPSLLCPHRP